MSFSKFQAGITKLHHATAQSAGVFFRTVIPIYPRDFGCTATIRWPQKISTQIACLSPDKLINYSV